MPEVAVRGPFGKDDLADELGLDPVRGTTEWSARWRRKRRRLLTEPIQSVPQLERKLLGEARADLAAEDQTTSIVVPNEQRANAGARAFGVGEPPDDEFLAL